MSIDYAFHTIDIDCEFETEKDARGIIKKFNDQVEIENEKAADEGESRLCCFAELASYHKENSNKPIVHLFCDAETDEWVNIDALQKLIIEYFPKGYGYISYAWATVSAGGYVRECGGGRIEYDNGKWRK